MRAIKKKASEIALAIKGYKKQHPGFGTITPTIAKMEALVRKPESINKDSLELGILHIRIYISKHISERLVENMKKAKELKFYADTLQLLCALEELNELIKK